MRTMFMFSARPFLALLATLAVLAFGSGAQAMGTGMHYRASEHFGGMHYRASNVGCTARSITVYNSGCRGPVVVTTWRPYPTTGFVFSSVPTVISQPTAFPSSRGLRSLLGGFVQENRSVSTRNTCSYNGSRGSNLAAQRKINWNKRARVHSPTLVSDHGK